MLKLAKKFWNDEQGLELSEYAVMVAIIIVVTIATIAAVGTAIKLRFEDLHTALTTTQ
jgi:Flp pilus assembly pilin Flp